MHKGKYLSLFLGQNPLTTIQQEKETKPQTIHTVEKEREERKTPLLQGSG